MRQGIVHSIPSYKSLARWAEFLESSRKAHDLSDLHFVDTADRGRAAYSGSASVFKSSSSVKLWVSTCDPLLTIHP